MGQKYDAIIIGAGPSGIFLAYELVQKGKHKNILLLEQGRRVEKRSCPIEKGGKCVKCKPLCNITCGFSGAGAFSDGKLSLYNDEDEDIYVGGYLQEYIGVENTKRLTIDAITFAITIAITAKATARTKEGYVMAADTFCFI